MIIEPTAELRGLANWLMQSVVAFEQAGFTRQESINISLTLLINAGDSDE